MEKINRESRALFSSESRVSMRGQVYTFLGVSCGIWFWVSKRERERSNRVEEGERAAQYGRERESTKRESVQCVSSVCAEGCLSRSDSDIIATVLNITEFDFQKFKSDS